MSVFIGYPSFMAYQMMKGKKGNNDGFPSIPGMIARYSALGLTNEQMAENPVWKDLMGNGYDLQMKNFAWSGMSGVDGYEYDFLSSDWVVGKVQLSEALSYKITIVDKKNSVQFFKYIRNESENTIKITLKVTGIEINGCTFRVYDNASMSHAQDYKKDGIYQINYTATEGSDRIYFYVYGGNMGQLDNPITIEQLPIYPGFILGDGVDDFAVTEKELNFEDTYTVYTAFIPFQDDPARNMILCGKNDTKDFSINYSGTHLNFKPSTGVNLAVRIDQFALLVCKRNKDITTIINLSTGESRSLKSVEFISNPGLYYLWRNVFATFHAKAAIAGQTICNGYFSTDEDDEKVLNWYKKQYPWLFLDQAWTVVGKTNEDKDRATVANITGNGNNLVLSNFGFAEGSGYGLYAENYSNSRWFINNSITATKKSDTFNVTSINQVAVPIQYIAEPSQSPYTVPSYTIKVTGLTDGQTVNYGVSGGISYPITQDGIYILPGFDFAGMGSWYGFQFNKVQETCDITIEQIPEYEGYLVTDGVDDEVRSAAFTLNKDWTIVGNWEFITNENKKAGLTKVYSFYLYNRDYGISVYKYTNAGQGFSVENVKSLKAICSDGRIYLNDWQEIRNNIEQEATISKGVMAIGYFNRDFTKVAFKNLGIYNDQLLSKDDCIKAYNYLQTLKAK